MAKRLMLRVFQGNPLWGMALRIRCYVSHLALELVNSGHSHQRAHQSLRLRLLAWHIGEFQQQDQPDQRYQDGAGTLRKGKLLWKRQHNKHNGHTCKADRAAQHSPIERSAAQPKPSNISKSAVPNQTPIAPCRLRPKRSEIAAGTAESRSVAVETIRDATS
jgi:hypothetical protein